MSIARMTENIKRHDIAHDKAQSDMDKALNKFDEKKALKYGNKYIKEFVEKILKPLIINNGKNSYKVSK